MTDDEKQLLENVFDGLDRIFDGETNAIDLHALIFATSKALQNTEYFAILEDTAESLETVICSGLDNIGQRDAALMRTDDLRIFLASRLDFF